MQLNLLLECRISTVLAWITVFWSSAITWWTQFSTKRSSILASFMTVTCQLQVRIWQRRWMKKNTIVKQMFIRMLLYYCILPKKSMRDKLNNVPMDYPSLSKKISEYYISLIKHGTSFPPSQRSKFNEIIDDIFSLNFGFAWDVDLKTIIPRFC